MNKRKIYLIIGLASVAVFGLLVLQSIMIRTAMEVNEQRYDEALRDALRQAAKEQEEWEARKINLQVNGYVNRRRTLTTSIGSGGLLNDAALQSNTRFDIISDFENSDLVDRLKHDALNDRLHAEFDNADLDGKNMIYGVYDNRKNKFISRNGRLLSEAGSDTLRHDDLMSSPYRVALLDGDGKVPGYLIAYNPRKNSVLFQSIWTNLFATILFVGVILACFAYTIYTILFQNRLSRMKTDFINNMTHEFKTPIATISLATDSIATTRVLGDPDKVMRFVNIIKQENRRMNGQVEKVLQMAKLEKNKLKLNLSEVDLNELAIDAASYISLQVEPRGGTVKVDAQADPATVEGDQTHLASLINNLLDNANKYSPEAPEIIIRTRTVAKGVEVTITDHGIGMSREARKNIFNRFYRVHTGDRHDVKGFGLGLSYVKIITDLHHGSVDVQSEPGEGSSFTVTFPHRQPA